MEFYNPFNCVYIFLQLEQTFSNTQYNLTIKIKPKLKVDNCLSLFEKFLLCVFIMSWSP